MTPVEALSSGGLRVSAAITTRVAKKKLENEKRYIDYVQLKRKRKKVRYTDIFRY